MAEYDPRPLHSLNPSRPPSAEDHDEITTPAANSPDDWLEGKSLDTGSQRPVTTYNGVMREHIRNAQPLFGNEIRVLDLNKGNRGMPLVGSLRRVRLSDRLSNSDVYEPLSYTWEDCDSVQTSGNDSQDYVHPDLFLMDSDCSMKLTSNCAKALCTVRKAETERTIWVDSICVNQDDPEERSRQVDLMKEIYARAFTVLVYLGRESVDGESSSSMAMSLLREPGRLQDSALLDQYERTSIKRLFERRYFRRMWIVQEVALAQNLELFCGPDKAYISEFAGKPLKAILGTRVTPPWLRHSKLEAHSLPRAHKVPQAESILSLIFDTALCDCKDDRDKIFALFSLLDSNDEERPRADYSLSTTQVYTRMAAYLAKTGLLWGVLMLAPRLAPNSYPGIPSWVPDWRSVGKVGLPDPTQLLNLILSRSQTLGRQTEFGVASSGVMTIRGILLGSVTMSEYNQARKRDDRDIDQMLVADLFSENREPDESSRRRRKTSVWTLTRPNQDKSRDSWTWQFQFLTSFQVPRDANHVAFILPDYSTVLILRSGDSLRDPYALVEVGMPLVWEVNLNRRHRRRQNTLGLLNTMQNMMRSQWETILSSTKMFPGLSKFPELWSYNPLMSTMSLTHAAIRKIRHTDMSDLSLLRTWQKEAHIGLQILRDKFQLRSLIMKVNSLLPEEYKQIERASRLDLSWPLDHFLSLFIRDPYNGRPMTWPDVQLRGEQHLDDIAVLSQLMCWAHTTYHVLVQFSKKRVSHWLKLLRDKHLHRRAHDVAEFQVCVASADTTNDAGGCLDRTSILLEKILQQLSDESNHEVEQVQGPRARNEYYWDWNRFNCVMDRRFSVLSQVQPDVEKIQAWKLYDFRTFTANQALASHDVDLRKDNFTHIMIR